MEILIANDTGSYHCGSRLTMENLERVVKHVSPDAHVTFLGNPCYSPRNLGYWNHVTHDITKYDAVIINGEGSVHGGSMCPYIFYELAKKCNLAGIKCSLVNTSLYNLKRNSSFDLSVFHRVYVRETRSAEIAEDQFGIYSPVVHDLCFYDAKTTVGALTISYSRPPYPYTLLIDSCYFTADQLIGSMEEENLIYLPMRKMSLRPMIRLMFAADNIYTGRYHGLVFYYMIAESSFLCIPHINIINIEQAHHKLKSLEDDYANKRIDFDELSSGEPYYAMIKDCLGL